MDGLWTLFVVGALAGALIAGPVGLMRCQPGADDSSGGPVAGALEASAVLLGGITATGVD